MTWPSPFFALCFRIVCDAAVEGTARVVFIGKEICTKEYAAEHLVAVWLEVGADSTCDANSNSIV